MQLCVAHAEGGVSARSGGPPAGGVRHPRGSNHRDVERLRIARRGGEPSGVRPHFQIRHRPRRPDRERHGSPLPGLAAADSYQLGGRGRHHPCEPSHAARRAILGGDCYLSRVFATPDPGAGTVRHCSSRLRRIKRNPFVSAPRTAGGCSKSDRLRADRTLAFRPFPGNTLQGRLCPIARRRA